MSEIKQNIEKQVNSELNLLLQSLIDLLLNIEILNHRVAPIIEDMFYAKLGKLQFEVKSLELDVFRNKRRIDLINAELNKNITPDFNIIEKKIDTEFLVWKSKVSKLGKQFTVSIVDKMTDLNEEQHDFLKNKMRIIISKIHPSIADSDDEDLPLLYENAQKYFQFGNIAGLEIICDEIKNVDSIKLKHDINIEDEINYKIIFDSYENLIFTKTIEKEKLMSSFPLGYVELINDTVWIQNRKDELIKIKGELQSQNNLLKQVLNFIKHDLDYGQFSLN